jgi:glucose-6-phosphate dehydrogenase assembly protein OpcA
MSIELTSTNASTIASALLQERRKAGSPAMGMVLTLVVVTDEGSHYDAIRAAKAVSHEHPSRILGVIRRSARGAANLDAEVRIGDGGSGETVLLRMSGPLTKHSESVVLPLLLPDSPVVVWWPNKAPDDPATDPLGRLAKRRITDTASVDRGRAAAMLTQATNYSPGNSDLSWTRLTPWRALLAAALDQYPTKVKSGRVAAERINPSADLLAAWLSDRLKVKVDRVQSKGPGITTVSLTTSGGDIVITRPDGLLAEFSIPNAPTRPVALKRRELAELLAEELRRLDPDDVYAETVRALCRINDTTASKARGLESARSDGQAQTGVHEQRAKKAARATAKPTARKAAQTPAKKAKAKKSAAKRVAQ